MKPTNGIATTLKDAFGEPLFLGDIIKDVDESHGPMVSNPWLYHYVQDPSDRGEAEIRDLNAHNIGMCYEPKRLGPWNDPAVIKELLDNGQHKTAKDIERDVWELMSAYDDMEMDENDQAD